MPSLSLPTISALTLSFLSHTAAQSSPLAQCGTAYYSPQSYTCTSASILCPIINAVPTLPCGTACYSTLMYACDAANSTLSLLPPAPGAFTLTASRPGAPTLDGLAIEAAGNAFYIGQAPATYCPSPPVPVAECPEENETVFYNGALAVEVPGGQTTYITTTGALAFTTAHTFAEPDFLTAATAAYDGGGYFAPGGAAWLACPVPSQDGVWQVFADLPGVGIGMGCVGFYAVVRDVAENSLGAWEYV